MIEMTNIKKFSMNGCHSKLLIRNATIPNTRFGENVLRALRVFLQLLPQLAHINAHVFGVVCICRPPDLSQNTLMREHAAMIGSEIGKQFIFRAG